MDIDFGVFGEVIVDHVGDALDIEAARGEIGGDEDFELAFAESFHDFVAFGLIEIAVDFKGVNAVLLEMTGDIADGDLHAAEDDGEGGFFMLEQVGE